MEKTWNSMKNGRVGEALKNKELMVSREVHGLGRFTWQDFLESKLYSGLTSETY